MQEPDYLLFYIIFYLDIKKTGRADTILPVNTEYDID